MSRSFSIDNHLPPTPSQDRLGNWTLGEEACLWQTLGDAELKMTTADVFYVDKKSTVIVDAAAIEGVGRGRIL